MFFKSDDVSVIQFGTGDIDVTAGLLGESEVVGAISLMPREPRPIDVRTRHKRNTKDTDIGVHTRLVFTNEQSIDVLIAQLRAAKRLMLKAKRRLATPPPA